MTAPVDADLFLLTARLRRAQPRNADVLKLCERAEKLAHGRPASAVANAANKPKCHRAAYMRTYMRQRRAKQGETSP
jgi:hypothetical protein